MASISVPTAARLPSSLRLVADSPIVHKILNRLSRPSLLSLTLEWLDDADGSLSAPYLLRGSEDEDQEQESFLPPAYLLDDLRELYGDMQQHKGSKREVVDRIIEGDWRHGLSLYQLAMADFQYLHDHPTSQKWSAYRVMPLQNATPEDVEAEDPPRIDKESLAIPRFHPSSFLQNLQAQVLPDVKAHYAFKRHETLPLLFLRIFILDSPYNTDLAATDKGGDKLSSSSEASRTVYIAFPDASSHIFVSKSQTVGPVTAAESKSLRSLIIHGIPKALSRPRERYTLKSTSLSTRNMEELLHRRGSGRSNSAGGGWAVYADDKNRETPLTIVLPTPPLSDGGSPPSQGPTKGHHKRLASPATQRDERSAKRNKKVAEARFGSSSRVDDGKGVERVDIVIEDPFFIRKDRWRLESSRGEASTTDLDRRPRRSIGGRRSQVEEALQKERDAEDDEEAEREEEEQEQELDDWRPSVRLALHGTHVFAGIRQLVESGIIDGERMPGWMTGEEGISIGAVQRGRIRGHKGSGI